MLFHVGVLWRLNEVGWLSQVDRVSSVSGGSVTATVLALAWDWLQFDGDGVSPVLQEAVVQPVRKMAQVDLDLAAVRGGLLAIGTSTGDRIADGYRQCLYGQSSLLELPDHPRFVLNATNVGSGSLAHFSKPFLADWRVGRILNPAIEVAVAVACSSAFPPFLSPYRLDLRGLTWTTDDGNDLATKEHRDEWLLTDGGVYDNLGLETAWRRHRTVLVSDAGGRLQPDSDPDLDWGRHLVRVLNVVDHQVRSLRKKQVVGAYRIGTRQGAYIGIRSNIDKYGH